MCPVAPLPPDRVGIYNLLRPIASEDNDLSSHYQCPSASPLSPELLSAPFFLTDDKISLYPDVSDDNPRTFAWSLKSKYAGGGGGGAGEADISPRAPFAYPSPSRHAMSCGAKYASRRM